MLLDLDARADWTSLRRVIAKKSYLFQKPNARKGRSYLVMGDVVGALSKSRDWLSVNTPMRASACGGGYPRLTPQNSRLSSINSLNR